MAKLNGIDISKWQGNIDLAKVPSDFVIVKATQANNYVNPYFKQKVDEALALGKLVGVYHYCASGVGAENEAKFFVDTIRPYLGKVTLFIDWESDSNPKFGDASYVLKVLDTTYELAKVKPAIYQSKSVCRTSGMDKIAAKYELWCAQYASNNPQIGYRESPWTDNKGFGPWTSVFIYQYSSKGRLDGYSGDLDLDKAYCTKEEWLKRCKVETVPVTPTPTPSPSTGNNLVGKMVTVTASNSLNIRQKADKSSTIVGVLKSGSKIKVDRVENGMAHFAGYCSIKYLS